MGEAKRRAMQPITTVFHHTSTLRTNLIWMSGVIELEGRSQGALHPLLGEVLTDVGARRPCKDFGPLAWFTSDIRVPGCLRATKVMFEPKGGGPRTDASPLLGQNSEMFANGMALNRVALGFPVEGTGIVRWKDHPGYSTDEGRELNETAREQGDDPNRWYVSEAPVDVLKATEIWTAGNIFRPKLEKQPSYLKDVHRMVALCRENPRVYIPPTWLNDKTVQEMIRQSGNTSTVTTILEQIQSRHGVA